MEAWKPSASSNADSPTSPTDRYERTSTPAPNSPPLDRGARDSPPWGGFTTSRMRAAEGHHTPPKNSARRLRAKLAAFTGVVAGARPLRCTLHDAVEASLTTEPARAGGAARALGC